MRTGIDDQATLTTLGREVTMATALENTVAVLVAVTEGLRGTGVDDRAVEIVSQVGGPAGN